MSDKRLCMSSLPAQKANKITGNMTACEERKKIAFSWLFAVGFVMLAKICGLLACRSGPGRNRKYDQSQSPLCNRMRHRVARRLTKGRALCRCRWVAARLPVRRCPCSRKGVATRRLPGVHPTAHPQTWRTAKGRTGAAQKAPALFSIDGYEVYKGVILPAQHRAITNVIIISPRVQHYQNSTTGKNNLLWVRGYAVPPCLPPCLERGNHVEVYQENNSLAQCSIILCCVYNPTVIRLESSRRKSISESVDQSG
jgi:hypothetical protein